MSGVQQSQLKNRILSRLSGDDFLLLAGCLTLMDCPRAMVVSEADQPIPYMLFPETAVVSIVVQTSDGQTAEAGLVGREGFVATSVLLGTDRTPCRVEIQIPGDGYRMEVANFVAAVGKSQSLREVMLRFTQSLIVQTTYTAMSNAYHPVEERLARWLLMCDDRLDGADLCLTHKFMSVMLAVRRASVTTALQALESNRFIRAERGFVMITNRSALEDFAGDAYGRPEAEYQRLLGPL